MITIAIDAMGGDNAPDAVIRGACEALKQTPKVKLLLFGPEELLQKKLRAQGADMERIEVVDAPEIISLHEAPVLAIRKKKDSSIVKGLMYVKEGKADAFVSAGSSGAVLAGGQLIVGRIKGVDRPPLGALIPTRQGVTLLVDCGANVDAKPQWLLQYAQMGSIYMRDVVGVKNPSVGLVNIGAEEEKGNTLVKETMPLLKSCDDLRFIGSVEAREIPEGGCDVIVADAFVGNVILKLYEGVGATLISMIKEGMTSTPVATVGAALAKPALKKTLKKFDASRYGGAPLLGLKGLVVKVHGNTKGSEITNAISQCAAFVQQGIVEKIEASIAKKEN